VVERVLYCLGKQLPIDRFLTFYCGHPGSQINNMLIILYFDEYRFIHLLSVVFIGTLNSNLTICKCT
ncbi:hypothetical protein BDZ97DRAFT_1614912, partial [Flammula alnicola]